MFTTDQTTEPTESNQTTAAVESKPARKPLKTYPVIALVASDSGGAPTAREIKIQARCKRDAELFAGTLFVFLGSARAREITTEYSSPLCLSGMVLKVGPAERSKKSAGHVWTGREIAETLFPVAPEQVNHSRPGDDQMSLMEVDA